MHHQETENSPSKLRLWDVESGQMAAEAVVSGARAKDLAFSPDGRLVATASIDGAQKRVRLWDVKGGKILRQVHFDSAPSALAFSPDGRTLAAGCRDGTVWLCGIAQPEGTDNPSGG